MYRNHGAFVKYLVTSADFVVHVPGKWTVYDAARFSTEPFTAFPVLYDVLELLVPLRNLCVLRPTSRSYLGWRDLSRSYAIRNSCACVIPSSQHKFDLVRLLSTDAVVDYADPVAATATKQIRGPHRMWSMQLTT